MTSKKEYIMNDIQNKLNWLKLNTKHNIIYIAHQGSANYGAFIQNDEYQSDIDAKAICIPTFDDIVRGKKMVSHLYVMDDNSHIEVKDIRLFIDLWKKCNPSFLELLFSKYSIVCDKRFNDILNISDDIAAADIGRLLNCILGTQMQKYKELRKVHPSVADIIEKYGYDLKSFHHLYRMFLLGEDICNGKSFKEALMPTKNIEQLLAFKMKPMDLNTVEDISTSYLRKLKEIVDQYKVDNKLTVHTEVYEKLEDIIYGIIRDYCQKELLEMEKFTQYGVSLIGTKEYRYTVDGDKDE